MSVTFSFISPNSKIVASGSLDETIKFWDIQSGECLKALDNRPYTNTNITGIKGLNSPEIATLKALGVVEDGEM